MEAFKGHYCSRMQNIHITFIAMLGVWVALIVVVNRGTSRHICNRNTELQVNKLNRHLDYGIKYHLEIPVRCQVKLKCKDGC